MTLKRFFHRTAYYPAKYVVCLLRFINSSLFTKYFVRLLKFYGLNISGTPQFIASDVYFDDFNRISISERTVISFGCKFLTHDYSVTTALLASTGGGKSAVERGDIQRQNNIMIGKNVFIGANSFILPGTIIESNCIIGAGSVVRGKIPQGSVVIGNPAKVICPIERIAEKYYNSDKKDYKQD